MSIRTEEQNWCEWILNPSKDSQAKRYRYDPQAFLLDVSYGPTLKTYRYQQVPEEIWLGLLGAPHKMTYLHENVIGKPNSPLFKYEKVDAD